jgi:ADP-heptose:LPS heptosyltransferase
MSQRAQEIVMGGRSEAEDAAAFDTEEGIVNFVGRTSLRQLPAIIERCSVVVAGDTGPLHAAMALGVPVVALFGPTDERQFEFGERDACLTVELSCRPCRPHGSKRCPTGDWRCLPEIGVAAVETAVLAVVEKTGA